MLRNVVKFRFLIVLMLPMAAIVFVNSYLPMFGIVIAFKNVNYVDGILGSPWVGLDNFRFLLATSDAWTVTRNTLLYNLFFIGSGLVLAVTVAIALNEVKNKMVSKVYQTTMILPHFLSMVVVSYVVYAFLNTEYGLMNKTVNPLLGLEETNWYSEPRNWPYILTLTNWWKGVGMGSVIYLAAIAGIDNEMYEASVIDGATKWKQIRHITIPMLRPVMVIITILSLGGIFRSDFGLFYQVTLNSPALYPVTDVIDTYVYRALITLNDMGMSSAAGLYQSVVGLIMILLANGLVRKISRDDSLF